MSKSKQMYKIKTVYCIIITFLLGLVITTTVISDNKNKKEQNLYQSINFGNLISIEEIDIESITIDKDTNEYVILINLGGGDLVEFKQPITK